MWTDTTELLWRIWSSTVRDGKIAALGDEIPIGKFVECTDVPTLHGAEPALNIGPLVYSEARIPRDVARSIVEALM